MVDSPLWNLFPYANITYAVAIACVCFFAWRMTWWLCSPLAGLCVAYFAWSALRVFASPTPLYGADSEIVLGLMRAGDLSAAFSQLLTILTDATSAASLLILGGSLAAAWSLSVRTWLLIFQALGCLSGILDAIWIIQDYTPAGILAQASMSGCFAACVLPTYFAEEDPNPILILLTALPCFLSLQSLPLACFFIMSWFALLLNPRRVWWRTLGLWALPSIAFGLGYAICGRSLLDSSNRYRMWGVFMSWWHENAGMWTGVGSSAFQTFGPRISHSIPQDLGDFTFMHSEPLQVLWEQGVIGLVLLVMFYVELLLRAWDRKPLLLALLVYGAFSLANMPFRYTISALLGAFLVRWTFTEEPAHG